MSLDDLEGYMEPAKKWVEDISVEKLGSQLQHLAASVQEADFNRITSLTFSDVLAYLKSLLYVEKMDNADFYLLLGVGILTVLTFVQLRIFDRPPPVPLKRLPRRPALSILFKPDDTSPGGETTERTQMDAAMEQQQWTQRLQNVTNSIFRSSQKVEDDEKLMVDMTDDHSEGSLKSTGTSAGTSSTAGSTGDGPILHHTFDLPDSFAPLLSSSQTDVLLKELSADLIHAVDVQASVRVRPGRHEIPLNKDKSRPQLMLNTPKSGVRISVWAQVGSDKFTSEEDLDVTKETTERSMSMVKKAQIVLDPPLPLLNVAPTLIHFPTLFEDRNLPTFRRIFIVRMVIDFVISVSSLLEQILWIVESFCKIHLGKVQVAPLYRYQKNKAPEWRLSLSFSGHVQLFGIIPVPFISVTLPTFIIPQPHALLEYLMTKQPLASAKLHREEIAEERLALAVIDTAESFKLDLKLVATPPALGVDITLPGGLGVALEVIYGRDPGAGWSKSSVGKDRSVPFSKTTGVSMSDSVSGSSWATPAESILARRSQRSTTIPPYDANRMVPWSFGFSVKGSLTHEKMVVHVLKCMAEHEGNSFDLPLKSKFGTRGSLAVWKVDPSKPLPMRRPSSFGPPSALEDPAESPSVAAILMFPDDSVPLHQQQLRTLKYDYAFDVFDDTQVDAITVTAGASHPMLKGGTTVTTVLESIYACGSLAARKGALIDPTERRRKRNILRHLPAIDFTFGIQNIFIPPESMSYSDDGQTRCIPDMEGGRMTIRFLGGIVQSDRTGKNEGPQSILPEPVSEGVKVIADFGVGSLVLKNEADVEDFPELDILHGTKLRTLLSGVISGSIGAHLRPQVLEAAGSPVGPNIFNPLEAYEIDFSGSALSFKVKEMSIVLGHRRVIIPTETKVEVKIVESVVDMSAEGKTQCELSWDFQGLSPILQVTAIGESVEDAPPENKEQVSLLIAPLRHGRFNLNVSSVGGINVTKAATSREDKEGLYDWKFFNAIVSPDSSSAERLIDVLQDKRSMEKLLQVVKLLNMDLYKILRYVLNQVWRAKDIFDQEGVSDPKHAIPAYNMARLVSLFICGNVSEVDQVLPVVQKVVAGDGLDVVKVKELLRQHVEAYDDWAPELDRIVRWAAVSLGPMAVAQPYVEPDVPPLCEVKHYAGKLLDIPSAKEIYDQIQDKMQLPLDSSFSNLVGKVAPYLSFRQIEYFLRIRASNHWQAADLRRLRYVYSIKRKVLEIAESYGGLSFLPQSFLVSVFLGEATRSSMRSSTVDKRYRSEVSAHFLSRRGMNRMRDHRLGDGRSVMDDIMESSREDHMLTPAGRVAGRGVFAPSDDLSIPINLTFGSESAPAMSDERHEAPYELGDSLLGPQDVAILLQAGLTSAMKSSTVVQLNQRMLLDLMASQPRTFAIAVLAEIGTPGGQGSPRSLASALMALLELDQSSFKPIHRLEMPALLEEWLPGLTVPNRDDYMAGGRWARQSYYEAVFSLATSILEDAECYMALKSHIQRDRRNKEADPIPLPREEQSAASPGADVTSVYHTKLIDAVENAKRLIVEADDAGVIAVKRLMRDTDAAKKEPDYQAAIQMYRDSFDACAEVLSLDKLAFHSPWFREYYKRSYDALMIKSLYDNVIDDIDNVRYWLHAVRRGAKAKKANQESDDSQNETCIFHRGRIDIGADRERLFLEPEKVGEQVLVDAIIDTMIFLKDDRERLRNDPLLRLLIPNRPGKYNFTIVTAMGVITDGKHGLEMQDALQRLKEQRGVETVRADTGTARSLEYNAAKIQDAIEIAVKMKKPYGYVGYSQGCANSLVAESDLLSGSPVQQKHLINEDGGLVCRQLLFSAANGSVHGPAANIKVQRLIVMCEEFFKYQQGYCSRALASTVLEALTSTMDSSAFQKVIGGAQSFLPDGCRAFWREAQHLAHVPTCTLKGVMEEHTTPECLEMISHLLTKQSGSALHDSQVHVYDAIGHPVYHQNRNGRLLERCAVGEGAIQRTHHWSPLSDEVEFVRTPRDIEDASFECAKDRHIFPWVDVNVRFGFIKYLKDDDGYEDVFLNADEMHPSKLVK